MWMASNVDKKGLENVLNELRTYKKKDDIVTPEKATAEFARLKSFMMGQK